MGRGGLRHRAAACGGNAVLGRRVRSLYRLRTAAASHPRPRPERETRLSPRIVNVRCIPSRTASCNQLSGAGRELGRLRNKLYGSLIAVKLFNV